MLGMAPDDLMSLDFSLDLAIYAVFTLLITTATFWRITWKAVRREQPRSQLAKILITSAAVHVAREILIIKVRWWRDYFEVRTGMSQATKGKQGVPGVRGCECEGGVGVLRGAREEDESLLGRVVKVVFLSCMSYIAAHSRVRPIGAEVCEGVFQESEAREIEVIAFPCWLVDVIACSCGIWLSSAS